MKKDPFLKLRKALSDLEKQAIKVWVALEELEEKLTSKQEKKLKKLGRPKKK
jgi:hypothetical protein